MINKAATTESPSSTGTLTAAQRAEHEQKAEERALTKLGHAVTFLDNHLPMFGGRTYGVGENYKDDGVISSPLYMDDVPAEVREAMAVALVSAARFANECFTIKG